MLPRGSLWSDTRQARRLPPLVLWNRVEGVVLGASLSLEEGYCLPTLLRVPSVTCDVHLS